MTRLSEDALIARYFAPLATLPGADGLRDDAALLTPPAGMSLVITADALVAGVHFLPDDPPETIAAKALRVNLSDLAAKGAQPYAFTLSLALPGDWTEAWLAGFAAGLGRDAEAYGFALIGGDTVKTPGPLTIAVSAFGLVPSARIPRRAGAAAGDGLYVSGTIGDGAFGLLARRRDAALAGLPAGMREALITRYRLPQPRVALAPVVLAHASAAMDISDGFVGDLAKLLRASGASAEVDLAAVPLSPAARAAIAGQPRLFEIALTGGDDYEILCAVPAAGCAAFEAQARAAGVAVARIGTITAGAAPPLFRDADGAARTFAAGSFSHF
ncbi:thiamine-phosphate kinase [Labrys wisconsinensis]|uniref:Thiamine-monophosphate kinase n=1 Tax=Labrys wisconsinensis TaxID=425677 RepID=A0ABU0JDS9_9HYPH|nr:thiamine-phosphate kinase [Labrys wisconsinensis]MDQ0471553.1 thiamine-monophosphate kinase [Labrys wisconsinensis]